MSRSIAALVLLAALCSVAPGQVAYVTNSGWSFSSAYVGQDLQPAPNQFDQEDELGVTTSEALATWDNDAAWSNASLSTGGIFDYVQTTAGSDNTEHAEGILGDENAAWSTAEQSGTWSTNEEPVTYVFIANLAVSDETMTGSAVDWSENSFLSGEASAGPFEFTWYLHNGYLEWELHESGYLIDSGAQLVFPVGGAGSDWGAGVSKSVTDYFPAATETVSCTTNSTAFYTINHYRVRVGEAQTGVIISD